MNQDQSHNQAFYVYQDQGQSYGHGHLAKGGPIFIFALGG